MWVVNQPQRFAPALAGQTAFLLALVLAPGPGKAEGLRLEAETFTIYGNIGSLAIEQGYCGGASGEYGVNGLDVEKEWIMMPLTIPATFCFTDSIRSAGAVGFARTFALEALSSDGTIKFFADTLGTPPGTAPVG
jgi:hypothetical protein